MSSTGPAPTTDPTPSRWLPAHLKEPVIALLFLLLTLSAGLAWVVLRAGPPVEWTATQLNGAPVAFSPRVSPDGKSLAFVTLVNGNSYVAVMPSAGGPGVLITPRELGSVANLSWSPDGYFVYFDRFWDTAHGIYSVPCTGGRATAILRDAFAPLALPDGSLLVAQPLPDGDFQVSRIALDSGHSDPLPIFFDRRNRTPQIRVFPDGKEIVFFGLTGAPASHPGPPALYAYDPNRRAIRALSPGGALPPLPFPRPLAVTPDSKFIVTLALRGDLVDVIRIPRDGADAPERLLSFPRLATPTALDLAPDGSLFLDAVQRSSVVLRFPPEGGSPDQTPAPTMDIPAVLPIAGPNFVYSSLTSVRGLVTGAIDAEIRPFVQSSEESTAPMALAPGGNIAFLAGSSRDRQIALAALADGRVVRRIPARIPADIRSLAVSPQGDTVYYTSAGTVFSVPVEGNAEPRRIAAGDWVAPDPTGQFLYIKRTTGKPIAFIRQPLDGGAPETLAIPELTSAALSPSALDSNQRLVFETASPASYFSRPAIWDTVHQTLTAIPLTFPGDVHSPAWTSDGRILAAASTFQSTLWRYRKQ